MRTVRLLFRDDMARAIVEGRKTVTRRPIVPHDIFDDFKTLPPLGIAAPCTPGDLLIGRECWCPRSGGSLIIDKLRTSQFYRATDGVGDMKKPSVWPWRPSIHMPDWAARIRRRVVAVTVERVQSITEADAVREGFGTSEELEEFFRNCAPPGSRMARPRDSFDAAWDSIYAAKGLGWDANPWVWRIEFSAENVEGEK